MFGLQIGDEVRFAKTVGESDVYLFAGITGDFAANHVNEEAMRKTPYGGRIAHGALLVGYMSACSTMMAAKASAAINGRTPVSMGFDRIRFLAPVRIGDTVSLLYRIAALVEAKMRAEADVTAHDQHGTLVAVARHLLQWID